MSSSSVPALPSEIQTLADLFAWRVAETPTTEAYREHDPATDRWVSTTWLEAAQRVARFTERLSELNLARGARIAILLPNGLDAVCMDQAALALACTPVPMHALDNPASIAYILSDSDATLLIVDSDTQWSAIASVGTALPSLALVLVRKRESASNVVAGTVPVQSLDEWLSRAASPQGRARSPSPDAEDLAALVYTSGTTGRPKGVMLTHGNVVSNVKATLQRVAPLSSDVFLSFLPLSHTFERTAGYYLPIAAGSCVAFARSTSRLPEDMQAVRPTIMVSVPRIYERVYAKLQAMLAESPAKLRLFEWAQTVGWRRFCRAQGLSVNGFAPAFLDELVWPLLDRHVARPLLTQFGGRLRVAVSGGAALSQSIAQCFLGLGLPIVQGYGMTETSPVVAVNGLDDNDPATVGRALVGVDVRIGDNHELLVKGPNVMRGYWKRDEDTARAFVDGWLRTGDQASIDSGRIRILGRVKEIIVTSTGEKIAPVDLELAIGTDPLFDQAYAFGDNRPFIACVVVLNRAEWERVAIGLRLDPDMPGSLQAESARDAVLQRVRRLTASFPYYAQPRAVVLTLEPWTVENTLMTPTLKLKRNNLAAHFATQIEGLYGQRAR